MLTPQAEKLIWKLRQLWREALQKEKKCLSAKFKSLYEGKAEAYLEAMTVAQLVFERREEKYERERTRSVQKHQKNFT